MQPIAAFEAGTVISGNNGYLDHDACVSSDNTIEPTVESNLSQNSDSIEELLPSLLMVPDDGIEYTTPLTDLGDNDGAIEFNQPSMPSSVDIEGYYPPGEDVQSVGGTPWERTAGHWAGRGLSAVMWFLTGWSLLSTLGSGSMPLITGLVSGIVMGGGLGCLLGPLFGLSHFDGVINGAFIGSSIGLALGSIVMAAQAGPAAAVTTGSAWTITLVTAGAKNGAIIGSVIGAISGLMQGNNLGSSLYGMLKGALIGALVGGATGVFMGLIARCLTGKMIIPEPPAAVEPAPQETAQNNPPATENRPLIEEENKLPSADEQGISPESIGKTPKPEPKPATERPGEYVGKEESRSPSADSEAVPPQKTAPLPDLHRASLISEFKTIGSVSQKMSSEDIIEHAEELIAVTKTLGPEIKEQLPSNFSKRVHLLQEYINGIRSSDAAHMDVAKQYVVIMYSGVWNDIRKAADIGLYEIPRPIIH